MDNFRIELRREQGTVVRTGWRNLRVPRVPHDPNWPDKLKKGLPLYKLENWFGKDAAKFSKWQRRKYSWGKVTYEGVGYRPVIKGRDGNLVFTLITGQTLYNKRTAKRQAKKMLRNAKRIYAS
jgi:hypothetical protein